MPLGGLERGDDLDEPQELAKLAPKGAEHPQDLLVRRLRLTAEELEHPDHCALPHHRKRKSDAQAAGNGGLLPVEVRLGGDVRNPETPAGVPYATR